MGERRSKRSKKKKQLSDDEGTNSTPSSSSSTGSEYSDVPKRRKRSRSRRRRDDSDEDDVDSGRSFRGDKDRRSERKSKKREKRDRERKRKSRSRRRDGKTRISKSEDDARSSGADDSEIGKSHCSPESVVGDVLKEFPGVAGDLQTLLQMIDGGQAVDIRAISERSLVKLLKKLFLSLNLKERGEKLFFLPSNVRPTLEVVGSIICAHVELNGCFSNPVAANEANLEEPHVTSKVTECDDSATPCPDIDAPTPKRRTIGPEMPSAELLAAAAKLTEAEAELREAEVEDDTGTFIGPPPPALVAEAESANDAERFEEVTRIMGDEAESLYDILGVNWKMSAEGIKKKYWKLSLLVHPDKCPHPQAHQAFIKLNKAFKDLQDSDKRKELDDKIKFKEEQEQFKVELKAMREAAQWRRLQGISMEGDEELLAEIDVKKAEPRRDEWMTTLPPERRPGGMPTHSTTFSKNTKEGRGDTSAWTDTPSDRAQKAKTNYLEAYNKATALASNIDEIKRTKSDADLVDKYNKAKRSKSLVQKHQEETVSRSKRKSKQQLRPEKAEWEESHPWKPWDREKDLTAGRQSVKLDSDNMTQGLTSRFSSGTFQRNFL